MRSTVKPSFGNSTAMNVAIMSRRHQHFWNCSLGWLGWLALTAVTPASAGVGYINHHLPAGYGTVAIQLIVSDYRVGEIFSLAPIGTVLRRLSGRTWESNTNGVNGWSDPSMQLSPAKGYVVRSPEPWTLTFVGEVPQGQLSVLLPRGRSYRASFAPQRGKLSTVLGFPGEPGTKVFTVDNLTGEPILLAEYRVTGWHPTEPDLFVANSIMIESPRTLTWTRQFWVNDPEPPPPPVGFAAHPQSVVAELGSEVVISAPPNVSGLQVQWQHNGVDIPDATAATLTIPAVQREDAGSYWLRMRGAGIEFSEYATVSVVDPYTQLSIQADSQWFRAVVPEFPEGWTPVLEYTLDFQQWETIPNAFANGGVYRAPVFSWLLPRYYRLRLE